MDPGYREQDDGRFIRGLVAARPPDRYRPLTEIRPPKTVSAPPSRPNSGDITAPESTAESPVRVIQSDPTEYDEPMALDADGKRQVSAATRRETAPTSQRGLGIAAMSRDTYEPPTTWPGRAVSSLTAPPSGPARPCQAVGTWIVRYAPGAACRS
jgi:hypothetical protein